MLKHFLKLKNSPGIFKYKFKYLSINISPSNLANQAFNLINLRNKYPRK